MDLTTRRINAASLIFTKLDMDHQEFSPGRLSNWTETPSGLTRQVEMEHERGMYDPEAGTQSVSFINGTALPVRVTSTMGSDENLVRGDRLQVFLRSHIPSLASSAPAAAIVTLVRNYEEDVKALSGANGGTVTTAALARHILGPLQSGSSSISGLSFKRNEEDGTYEVKASLPIPEFPADTGDLSGFTPDQLEEGIKAGEAISDQIRKQMLTGTTVKFDELSVKTATHVYVLWDLIDAQRSYDIRNGNNLKEYEASEVAEATHLQIGDHAVLHDGAADCFVVATIDDEGLCHPIRGNLSFEDAEAMLNTLTADAEPVWQFATRP